MIDLIIAYNKTFVEQKGYEKYPILYDGMERVLCPRVHFKVIIIDSTIVQTL